MKQGRQEQRIVKNYLDARRANRPRRGRRRTASSIDRRLTQINEALAGGPSAVGELLLVQERRDLTEELEQMSQVVDVSALEDDFVRVAKSFGKRRGIAYETWREIGLEPDLLKRAGITR